MHAQHERHPSTLTDAEQSSLKVSLTKLDQDQQNASLDRFEREAVLATAFAHLHLELELFLDLLSRA